MALMQLGVFAAIPLVQQREKGILKRLGGRRSHAGSWSAARAVRLMVAVVDAVLILGIGYVSSTSRSSATSWKRRAWCSSAPPPSCDRVHARLVPQDRGAGHGRRADRPAADDVPVGDLLLVRLLPGFLQTIARFLPLTYLGDAMRQVMVNGTQVAPLAMDLAILTGWLVVCLTIAARTFRWE